MSLGNNRPALRSVAGLRICRTWVSSTDVLRSSLNCRHEKYGDCRNPQFKLEAYKLQIETANCIAVYLRILAQPCPCFRFVPRIICSTLRKHSNSRSLFFFFLLLYVVV